MDEAKEALQPLLQDHEIKMATQQHLLVHYRVGGVGLTPFGNQRKQLANHETTVRVRDGREEVEGKGRGNGEGRGRDRNLPLIITQDCKLT